MQIIYLQFSAHIAKRGGSNSFCEKSGLVANGTSTELEIK
jgi:hypothetical protein